MDGYVTIGTKLETKSFDAQIEKLEKKLEMLEKSADESNIPKKFRRSAEEARELNTQIEKTKNQLVEMYKRQNSLNKKGFNGVTSSIENAGKSMNKLLKKVIRWGLAIFGIRSMYLGIRSAINTISENDEQLKADIDYIKSALAYALEPIVRGIVNLVKQLMFYIGYIVKAWTGINIFANANKGLEKANKQAKELKKTTAGFDEMNILNTSSEESTVGPSFDLSNPEDIKVPSWLDFIVTHKDEILSILAGITAGLLAIKLGLTGIQALGIGIAVAGLVYTIQSIIKFLKNPTFKNFMKVLEGIAITISGIAIAFGAWPVAIAAAVGLIILIIIEHFDKIKELFNKFLDWIKGPFTEFMRRLFGPIGDIIVAPFVFAIGLIKGAFESLFGGLKKIIEGIVQIFKGDFKGGIESILSGFGDILLAPWNALKEGIGQLWSFIKKPIEDLVDNIKKTFEKLNPFKWIGELFTGGGSWSDIQSVIDYAKKKSKNKGGGRAKGAIFYPSKLPKLAVGGIINQPGRGVPYNGAIIGERGAEAVVPLTDSQQMALLGETIGRYVTINLTNITKLDSRQIARKVDKVQQNNNFVFNR